MVKNVFSGAIRNHPAALAILGWVAFVSGVVLPVPSVVKHASLGCQGPALSDSVGYSVYVAAS